MNFGKRVGELLKERKLSQKNFAEAINEDPVSVNRYIKGSRPPKVEFISKVVDYFPEVDLNWLFRGTTSPSIANDEESVYTAPKTPTVIVEKIENELKELKALLSQK